MHVTRQLFEIDSHSYSFDFGVERSEGCHLSDVIKYMSTKRYRDRAEDSTQAGWAGGFVLERMLAQHAIEAECQKSAAGLLRLGELAWCYNCHIVLVAKTKREREEVRKHFSERGHVGIFATPDAVLVKLWMLLEWKFTKRTMRMAGGDAYIALDADVDDDGELVAVRELARYEHISLGFWEWMVQIKGYCYLIGLLYDIPMLRALLMVLFVEGDYGVTTRDYTTAQYWLRFSERELRESWDMTVSHAIDGELLVVAV